MGTERGSGLHLWRASAATLALAGLFAACSAGGDETSGGGGGGGGTRRPGGNGNNLTLTPTFVTTNRHGLARTETIRASVPFTKGMVTTAQMGRVGVRGISTSWLPLQYWEDGSIKIAQAQFTERLEANEARTFEVVKDVIALTGAFARNEWVGQLASGNRIGARVRDTFNVPYEATVDLADGETVQETYLVRVRRHRVYHVATGGGGIGRDYLASTFYVTEYRDMPFVTVDWVLGNDYLGADDTTGQTDRNYFPLGAVDVKEASFLARGPTQVAGQYSDWHGIGVEVGEGGGWRSFPVMRDTYLDDGQARRYRFHLRYEHPGASEPVKQEWRDTYGGFVSAPLAPLANLATWQGTGGLGLHGGPISGPSNAGALAENEWGSWVGNSGQFGTWGSFGETMVTSTTGTPRNAPVSPELGHAIQSGDERLLTMLEQKAWIQACRPYHLHGLEVGAEENTYLWDMPPIFPGSRDLSPQSYGRRALRYADPYSAYRTMVEPNHRSHGWGWYDHEHWSTDLLFDYWSMSGDAWAQEELRLLGECLKGTMRMQTFSTSHMQAARAEGWTMVGFVQCYLATQDDSLRTYALRRVHEMVEVEREKAHPSRAIAFAWNYPGTGYGPTHSFTMAWQHAAVIYGYVAASKFFGDDLCMRIAEDVVSTVEYSWVRNFNDPVFGFVENGLRYYVPISVNSSPVAANHFDHVAGVGVKWGDSPLGGAHSFLISALHILYERAHDEQVALKALDYGRLLFEPSNDWSRWYKWSLAVNEELVR